MHILLIYSAKKEIVCLLLIRWDICANYANMGIYLQNSNYSGQYSKSTAIIIYIKEKNIFFFVKIADYQTGIGIKL